MSFSYLSVRPSYTVLTKLLLVAFFFIGAASTLAQHITVSQLEQILARGRSSGAAEEEVSGGGLLAEMTSQDLVAPRLAEVELSERLTQRTLTRLVQQYDPGPLTRSALELLADRSALLDPPSSETLSLPPPTIEAQTQMLAEADKHLYDLLKHLPDLFALLTTTHFDDGPISVNGQVLMPAPGLHPVGTLRREVTFRDGREVFDSSQTLSTVRGGPDAGLKSQGEFGPEAAMVLLDVKQGTLAWDHWEQGEGASLAVYRYTVPAGKSHYEVQYACGGKQAFYVAPAYSGTLSVDPASGELVRFTLQTDSRESDPIAHVSSVVEYGPVALGKRVYYCPLRSVTITMQEANPCAKEKHERKLLRPIGMLNRTIFSDYHRLGSEIEILPESVKAIDSTRPRP